MLRYFLVFALIVALTALIPSITLANECIGG